MLKNWSILTDRKVLNTPIFTVHQIIAQSPKNPQKKGDFVYLDVPSWINVIAITPDEKVIFVQQYRHGTQSVTLEIPGGMCEEGESFVSAGARELLEETGFQGSSVELIGVVDPNPAFQNNRCGTILVKDAQLVQEQHLDPMEEIDITLIPLAQVDALIRQGKITHSLVVAAFFHLKLHRSQ
ncbi:MAG: NUDIX hydrolase [Proteobacteria bacterium]|nr:NUDIX hydrolase [Pseudomonadota bacterium]